MTFKLDGTSGLIFPDNSVQPSAAFAGFRNRIINGDMRVSQRGNVTVNPDSTGNIYTAADRWSVNDYFGTTGQLVTSIDSDVPIGQGFTSSLRINCATTLSLNYGSARVRQHIEGYNAYDLFQSDITASFWVKSSVTGQYTVQITNGAYDRVYSTPITISAANTWEKKSVVIPLASGTSSGVWNSTNGVGLSFVLYMASTVTTGIANVWGSTTGVIPGQAAWGTAGHDLRITGVQLEAGSIATPFERRPYKLELELCQWYLLRITTGLEAVAIMPQTNNGGTLENDGFYYFPTEMRVAPTVTAAAWLLQGHHSNAPAIEAKKKWIRFTHTGTNARDTGGVQYANDLMASAEL